MFAVVAVVAAVVVQAVVFVVENAHARRRLQEPPGLQTGTSLSLGGYPFLKYLLEPLSGPFLIIFDPKMVPKWVPIWFIFRTFPENVKTLIFETPHTV